MPVNFKARRVAPLLALLAATLGGCPDVDLSDLEEIELEVDNSVDADFQTEDPRFVDLPVGLEEDIILDASAEVIVDISTDLVVEELPDITLFGFENLTGDDIYIRYLVDGVLQGILVFDGEALFLDYPCVFEIELLSEEHFDIFTGELVDAFDLEGAVFFEGLDYFCGDAVIFTFDPFDITVETQLIDLF